MKLDLDNSLPVVLIVDDAATNIGILGACLRDAYKVKVATGGEQCLAIARTDPPPDLILLDIEMPVIDGYEVCRQLKDDSSTADIPIIFVTGRLGDKNEEYGFEIGAVDYITKPISPAIVRARVNTQVALKLAQDQLRHLAWHDQLTGLVNRHYLLENVRSKMAQAIRHQTPMSLLVLDIDNFKQVNDTYGHAVGDEVLKKIAQLSTDHNRAEDIVARFGGEEFVIVLDHCGLEAAVVKAEFLRRKIEQATLASDQITVSIGVAEFKPSSDDFEHWFKRADRLLYKAKKEGRNRVVSG